MFRIDSPVAGGLHVFPRAFPGVLGLCAGMDKNAEAVLGMDALGFGFVEVGTVTAEPQAGNPRPRLWRHPRMNRGTTEPRLAVVTNEAGRGVPRLYDAETLAPILASRGLLLVGLDVMEYVMH